MCWPLPGRSSSRLLLSRAPSSPAQAGGCSLAHFSRSLEAWKKDDAILIDVLEENEGRFSFNVRRCRYAEMYQTLGIPELGHILSCNRDYALIEGFNPDVELQRTQTIMEGAPFCDFRYQLRKDEEPGIDENPTDYAACQIELGRDRGT